MPECGYCKDCKWRAADGCCDRIYELRAKFQPAPCELDDESYVSISTEPNFGCVQFEPNETT